MKTKNYTKELFRFIQKSPTPYHAIAEVKATLCALGYRELCESEPWNVTPGDRIFVTRNGSSLIALRIPMGDFSGFMMTASHCDSPAFKIKENAEIAGDKYTKLSVERYGGMLCSSWLDRPLSIAGRVVLRTDDGMKVALVDLGDPCALIPNVAIHMNRSANDGTPYNASVDMLPLVAKDTNLRKQIAKALDVKATDILSTDLIVYNRDEPTAWGDYISAPRLDDLQCAYGALQGFLEAETGDAAPVFCLFDNEEVGSETKQGAASTFLSDVLTRVSEDLGVDLRRKIANSFLVSCDNAHAVHPNHPEYKDPNHAVYMNEGIVVKYNANQRYTSDAVSAALFTLICEQAEVKTQRYANRADMAGGSTLGNIANTQVSLNTVDIGLAQLAMHSAYETAGAKDTESLVRALATFYASSLVMKADGTYEIKRK